LVIVLAVIISVGGGTGYAVLEITTKPEFCSSCHIMEPYYESWASSSHKDVSCVECHYEPGLLQTFEGKFKALSQLAKYATATEGSKPWAEVSDNSCMRSGCHSSRLVEGEISFGRIRFDHRQHLVGLRREKKLRCTSCHSQVVQGDHLTVTPSSCFLCHFKSDSDTEPIDDCELCHGPPTDAIALGDFTFRHEEYLDRDVGCESCHGDVVRGTGSVPAERCGSCHNKLEHLERIGDVEFMHRNHVTEHSVTCLDCHLEIEHGLTTREEHYAGDCTDCHAGSHGVSSSIYQGLGGVGVEDDPSVMFEARVTCTGCHRPPFPGAPVPRAGATFRADPLACLDCHGPGFEGMAESWQEETRHTLDQVQANLEELYEMLEADVAWDDGDPQEARRLYDAGAENLGLVLLDASEGVHNLPYARALMGRAADDVAAGFAALDPGMRPKRVTIGPAVVSGQGCTTLCHVSVESVDPAPEIAMPFDHASHVTKGRLDCSTCHVAEPHGRTTVSAGDCVSCHHADDEPDTCSTCHAEVGALLDQRGDDLEILMEDFDCITCHAGLDQGHSVAGIQENCDFCHEDIEADFSALRYAPWIEQSAAPLARLEARLLDAPSELAEGIREAVAALRRAGPHHNPVYVEAEATRLGALLDPIDPPPDDDEDPPEPIDGDPE
jgi:nitrate/TMAO reductase-like tetraheme cytochrome c subunit